ncbi:ribulose-phosphate 3-epimerase [Anaerorhabdus sp.]|uniref:ribulose-phosphate 3-epimerase n=1 Tax=Anaerorhabdus sp. TaxID=1872524 RepID=UPI002FCAF8D1
MILCSSMMCIDYDNLKDEVISLDEAGIDIFHCDVMDGNFVSNLSMGLNDIKCIRKNTSRKVDVHLMMNNPSNIIDTIINLGVDIIYIHPESERKLLRTIEKIKDRNVGVGLAINPETSVESILEVLYYVDYLLIMTVNPGFAGQKFIKHTLNKILKLIELKENFDYQIIIDGACSLEVINDLSSKGVDGFVLGTSALFGKMQKYEDILMDIRKKK